MTICQLLHLAYNFEKYKGDLVDSILQPRNETCSCNTRKQWQMPIQLNLRFEYNR